MTTFQDGPAQGKTLMLRRCARFLRVVRDLAGEIDALDQPDDEPEPGEGLFAYEIVEKPGYIHLNTGRKPGGGAYPMATYRLCPNQPSQADMRTMAAWHAWTEANNIPRPDLE